MFALSDHRRTTTEMTRRDFVKVAGAGLPLVCGFAAVNSTFHGVRIGVQSASFTFSGFNLDEIIKTMVEVGLAETDVMSEHVENYLGAPVPLPGTGRPGPWARPRGAEGTKPPQRPAQGGPQGAPRIPRVDPAVREALRKWRLTVPLEEFQKVGKKFTDAGLKFFSYNLSFREDFTDEEIDRGFQMTKALGTDIITASSPVAVFPRLVPFAEKYGVRVALHNHREGPEDFSKVMEMSRNFWINLDVGHFVASGYDPIAYMKEHRDRITNIHLKDRKKNNGPEMEFGQGDTPLKEILQLMKKEKYPFPAHIEYVGPAGPRAELAKCLEFCRKALE